MGKLFFDMLMGKKYFHIYGFLIGLGVFLGIGLSERVQRKLSKYRAEYKEINLERIILRVFVGAIIGARLYHVIDYWSYYSQNLIEIFKVWEGGMGIWGAIMGGVLSLILIYRKELKKVIVAMDLLVFGAVLAQIMGRLGNFFNHELFGLPTDLPWGMYVGKELRIAGLENFERFHPLFAYEMVLNWLLLWILLSAISQKRRIGYYLWVYIIGYGLIRFSLDFLRVGAWMAGPLGVSQWMGLVMVSMGLWRLMKLKSEK